MKNLVTIHQAMLLKELGYKEVSSAYAVKSNPAAEWLQVNLQGDVDTLSELHRQYYLLIPTVDEAIDWIRRKFNIVIYNSAAPFVDPATNSFISYSFKVKFCNVNHGYNFRDNIGSTKWSKDIYAAKRQAITIAIGYAKILKSHKAKIVKMPTGNS